MDRVPSLREVQSEHGPLRGMSWITVLLSLFCAGLFMRKARRIESGCQSAFL